jgi:hypothetical protein
VPATRFSVIFTCRCGSLAWSGSGDAVIDRASDGRVVIDAGDEWRPGDGWECCDCHRGVIVDSLQQVALDETVDRWMASQRE